MIEYFLHFWGGAEKSIKKNLEIKDRYFWFKSEKEREDFINKLRIYQNEGLAIDKKEGVMTHKRTVAFVTLKYGDNIYKFEYDFGYEYEKECAKFMFEEGNYSCDCNKSLFINRHCDDKFKELDCGDEIELIELDIKYLD